MKVSVCTDLLPHILQQQFRLLITEQPAHVVKQTLWFGCEGSFYLSWRTLCLEQRGERGHSALITATFPPSLTHLLHRFFFSPGSVLSPN